MVALTVITYHKYLMPKIERKSYIMSNREETEEMVPINLDVVFPNMPCECKKTRMLTFCSDKCDGPSWFQRRATSRDLLKYQTYAPKLTT